MLLLFLFYLPSMTEGLFQIDDDYLLSPQLRCSWAGVKVFLYLELVLIITLYVICLCPWIGALAEIPRSMPSWHVCTTFFFMRPSFLSSKDCAKFLEKFFRLFSCSSSFSSSHAFRNFYVGSCSEGCLSSFLDCCGLESYPDSYLCSTYWPNAFLIIHKWSFPEMF